MTPLTFVRRSRLPASADDAYAWHARPGALPRLTPPWDRVELVDPGPGIQDGARATLRVKAGPFWRRWVAEHRDAEEGRQFRDVQLEGPFAAWDHLHLFEPVGEDACDLEDRIAYVPPLGLLGRLLAGGLIRRKLHRMFVWRHRTTAGDLDAWRRHRGEARLRVLVTGASGLVGSALAAYLSTQGHAPLRLVRRDPKPGDAVWDTSAGTIDLAPAEPIDAVVHLAGASVAAGRWTKARKAVLRSSRVDGTRLLSTALAKLEPRPQVLVMASGTGFYGDRGDEVLSEAAPAGEGFLAELARDWEAAADPARDAGIRVVPLRLGVVLTPAGGALPRLLGPAKLGLGGPLGSGRQYLPWIALDDVLDVVLRALHDERLDGPVNAVAPEAVTNAHFAKTLGRVLRRPAFLPTPAFALRLLLGEMADAMLLSSQHTEPRRLLDLDHAFRYPDLEGALRHVLGRTAREET